MVTNLSIHLTFLATNIWRPTRMDKSIEKGLRYDYFKLGR